jgi:hypothetical protein
MPVATFLAVHAIFWAMSGSTLAFFDAQEAWGRGYSWRFAESAVGWQGVLALFGLSLVVVLWRFGPRYRPWFLYSAAVLLVSLASGTVLSFGRHMLFAFPLLWAVADGQRLLRSWPFAVAGLVASVGHVSCARCPCSVETRRSRRTDARMSDARRDRAEGRANVVALGITTESVKRSEAISCPQIPRGKESPAGREASRRSTIPLHVCG